MVPSNLKLTFYRDYAFVLYIENMTLCLNRTGSPAFCSGNGGAAYRIHHTTSFDSDRSHRIRMIRILTQAYPCSQCK